MVSWGFQGSKFVQLTGTKVELYKAADRRCSETFALIYASYMGNKTYKKAVILMSTAKRHLFLGLFFSIFFGLGLWIIEIIEGSKITTSLYIDVGYLTVVLCSFLAFPFYFISFFVLSVLVEKFLNGNFFVKLSGNAILGAVCGYVLFRNYYGDPFVREYGLNVGTAILVFTCIGLLLALMEKYLKSKMQ